MELVKAFLVFLFSFSLPLFSIGEKFPKKLRQYKICKENQCTSLKSSPSLEYMNKLLFSFSGWNKWSKCNKDCSTFRTRRCRFSFLCGSTLVTEEAFCFHRGSICEFLYQKYKRALASSIGSSERLSDYSTGHYPENEDNIENSSDDESQLFYNFDFLFDDPRKSQRRQRPLGSHLFTTNENLRKVPSDIESFENNQTSTLFEVNGLNRKTCGVARITHRNRREISMRILGGKETRKGRWPWQVAILNRRGETFCGGTLISPRWIITAAHCVRRRIKVTIGEHHLHTEEGTEKHYRIETAFIHPNFDPETVDNDIALLLLPESVLTDGGVACLPIGNQPLPVSGTMCTILGWGKERYNHIFGTSTLHEGRIPLVSNAECRLTYGSSELTNNMFCSGYRNGTVDSCAGDSGGPLLCRHENRWTIFGVTSFGDGCGRVGKYGIYAKVPNYVNWIYKVITATEESMPF